MKKKFLYLTLLVFCHHFLLAQNREIDSLLAVLKIQKEDTNKVLTLKKLALSYRKKSEYEKVLDYANKGVTLALKLNYLPGLSKCYHELGIAYALQSRYDKALGNFKESLKIGEKLGNKNIISSAFKDIGNIYKTQSNYPEALAYYTKALVIKEEQKDKGGMAIGYYDIGNIYEDQHNYNKALSYFTKAIKLFQEVVNNEGIYFCYNAMGNVYVDQNKYATAKEYYEKSLKMAEELGDKKSMSVSYINLGTIYDVLSDYTKALDYYNKALLITQEIKDKSLQASCLVNMGDLCNKQGNYKLALQQAKLVLQLSVEIGDLDNLRLAYQIIAKAESGLGNYKEAYLNHVKFKQLTDSIFNEENSKHISDIKTKYEVDKKETELRAANKIEQAKKDVQIQKQKIQRNGFIIGCGLLMILAIFIFRSYRQKQKSNLIITKQKEEVEQQRNIVQQQNKEILSSIEYAKRIQATILPPSKVVKTYLDDSFILYLPKDIVAGDFYWLTPLQSEGFVLFAACDCTGHGVPGVMVSVVCSNALNKAVNEYNIKTPSLILDKVAELVVSDFSRDENENVQDGMDISLCAFNAEKMQLEWAGANNPIWIIRDGNILETKADKQPIGKYDTMHPFTNHKINIARGDTIYLFTDGYADQFGGDKNKKLTKAGFKEVLLSIQHLSMDEQRNYLFEFHNAYRGFNEQVDDILVIGVRV